MKIFYIGVLSSLALMGCATTSQYNTKLATLVGQPEDVLISKWGKPTSRYSDENGDEVIAYIRDREVIVPGTSSLSGATAVGLNSNFGQVSTSNSPTGSINLKCLTKFVMKNGVVNSFTFKGNDCKTRNW